MTLKSRRGHVQDFEWFGQHQIDKRDFKRHEIVKRANKLTRCKVCKGPMLWNRTSFSNLTCGPVCRKIYRKRQRTMMSL